jgi:hypothetical protein
MSNINTANVSSVINDQAGIGWTTTGHHGLDVTFYSYLPGDGRIVGLIENTDVARIVSGVWEIKLADLTNTFYNDAEAFFKSVGAEVTRVRTVNADGIMTVKSGDVTLVIPENKNYVFFNGEKFTTNSVNVWQTCDSLNKWEIDKVFVNKAVLDRFVRLITPGELVGAIPSASVKVKPGNTNLLTITVTETYSNGATSVITEDITIRNNAAGTYNVGSYQVFVNTKGNDQIREIRIVD